MDTHRIIYLLQRYLDGRIIPEEQEELNRILRQGDHAEQIREVMGVLIGREQGLEVYDEMEWEPFLQKIRRKIVRPTRRLWFSAAAALVLLSVAVWLLTGNRKTGKPLAAAPAKPSVTQDLAPGSNRATLTLADNSTIDLDAAKEGVLGQQGNMRLIKEKDGRLNYQPADEKAFVTTMAYNLLATPRGGQYQLVLPDGSKVWLNAASRLKYPASFGGKERVVELQGEAYFEIARNPSMPFKVALIGQPSARVEVLGTHFNVKAYSDEPSVQATLLEGAIKIHQGTAAVLLQPGQQARWNSSTNIKVSTADLEEAIAWKNGLFKFNDATIEEVMLQLSRWYDVDIVYVNGVPKDLFRGEIYRSVNVSKLLKVLEASGVHFTVEGKKILVRN
ncbi:MAG: FecR domain-containing protein [Chitinophagaceae bacterium]|nr:FecR domain-containing protein [Chitinophagaceae bacterium]